ncbi:hypothetical protein COOONC_15893 [Cooperia oncophora]
MGPRCTRWRIVLLLISLSAVLTSYNWIADPTLRSVSLWESLQSHPVFSVSVPLLFILLTSVRNFTEGLSNHQCKSFLNLF